jgi:hypothetical protein
MSCSVLHCALHMALTATRHRANGMHYMQNIHSFIHSSMALQHFVGPWPLFQFRNPTHSRRDSLEGEITLPQGRDKHTERHTHRINGHRHSLPRVQKNNSCIIFSCLPYTMQQCKGLKSTILKSFTELYDSAYRAIIRCVEIRGNCRALRATPVGVFVFTAFLTKSI